MHNATQHTPKQVTGSNSDNTSASDTHNGRWIETVSINVGKGLKICGDVVDETETANGKIAAFTGAFVIVPHCEQQNKGRLLCSVWVEKGTACE